MGPLTKRPGRPKRGRLADMTIYPATPDACFVPPPSEACDEFQYSFDLAVGHRYGVRQVFRRGTTVVVYMAVWQATRVDGVWRQVTRLDSSHGYIHRHYFTAAGDEKVERIEDIVAIHADDVLDRWVSRAEDIMQNEWQANLRR
jgi:hypothetical protein